MEIQNGLHLPPPPLQSLTCLSPVAPGTLYSPGPTSAVLCTNKSGRFPVPKPTPLWLRFVDNTFFLGGENQVGRSQHVLHTMLLMAYEPLIVPGGGGGGGGGEVT